MLTLLKAEEVLSIGLTITQTFYLVGRQLSKKLCRFVKSDALKCAIATMLGINGRPNQVQDIRLTDGNGLRVWTSAGTEFLPGAEVCAFLTRYNRLAREGCTSTCNCDADASELWKKFCVHRIAEHLADAAEQLNLIANIQKKAQQRASEVMEAVVREGLIGRLISEAGDFLINVFHEERELGHIIVAENGELSVSVQRKPERKAWSVFGALSLLTDLVPKPKQAPHPESTAKILAFRQRTIFDTEFQDANQYRRW
jgi:hypothetical protein